MTSRLHRAARREISEAAIFYAERSQEIGERFLDAVESAILKIRETPERFRQLEPNLYHCRVAGFPYAIIYKVTKTELVILAVRHDRRRPDYWRSRLG
jgi:plasmid stabilization system protein ParE